MIFPFSLLEQYEHSMRSAAPPVGDPFAGAPLIRLATSLIGVALVLNEARHPVPEPWIVMLGIGLLGPAISGALLAVWDHARGSADIEVRVEPEPVERVPRGPIELAPNPPGWDEAVREYVRVIDMPVEQLEAKWPEEPS